MNKRNVNHNYQLQKALKTFNKGPAGKERKSKQDADVEQWKHRAHVLAVDYSLNFRHIYWIILLYNLFNIIALKALYLVSFIDGTRRSAFETRWITFGSFFCSTTNSGTDSQILSKHFDINLHNGATTGNRQFLTLINYTTKYSPPTQSRRFSQTQRDWFAEASGISSTVIWQREKRVLNGTRL